MSVGWSPMPRPKSDISSPYSLVSTMQGDQTLWTQTLPLTPIRRSSEVPLITRWVERENGKLCFSKVSQQSSKYDPRWKQGKLPPFLPLSLHSAFHDWPRPPPSWGSALNSWSSERPGGKAKQPCSPSHTWGLPTRLQKEPSGGWFRRTIWPSTRFKVSQQSAIGGGLG